MKKMMIALVALLGFAVTANAMSYEQAREQALFLTDKMAYELNLTEEQYEAAYEVNLDYLMGVNTQSDLYGVYWERRNLDLSYILLDWQYNLFLNASYFYRPLYWSAGFWHFGIYARYPHRNYFYFGRPHFYNVYRGGHSWHMNGGRSWYNGRNFAGNGRGGHHFGMHDRFERGDYGRGNNNHGGSGRGEFGRGNRFDGGKPGGSGNHFGNGGGHHGGNRFGGSNRFGSRDNGMSNNSHRLDNGGVRNLDNGRGAIDNNGGVRNFDNGGRSKPDNSGSRFDRSAREMNVVAQDNRFGGTRQSSTRTTASGSTKLTTRTEGVSPRNTFTPSMQSTVSGTSTGRSFNRPSGNTSVGATRNDGVLSSGSSRHGGSLSSGLSSHSGSQSVGEGRGSSHSFDRSSRGTSVVSNGRHSSDNGRSLGRSSSTHSIGSSAHHSTPTRSNGSSLGSRSSVSHGVSGSRSISSATPSRSISGGSHGGGSRGGSSFSGGSHGGGSHSGGGGHFGGRR